MARAQARRVLRQPLLHADPSDLHSGLRHASVEAHADEREPAQRRPRVGAEEAGRHAAARRRFPKPSATTTSSGAIRASATSCRATSRRATPRRSATKDAASATAAWRCISTSRTRSSASARDVIRARYGNLFDMYAKITDEDPYQRADADLPGHPLHDGRPVGRLQPDEHDPGPARPRRGELLRSRRQPARRERADAGAGRRLLRHPLHAGALSRQHAAPGRSRPITTRSTRRRPRCRRRSTGCCR